MERIGEELIETGTSMRRVDMRRVVDLEVWEMLFRNLDVMNVLALTKTDKYFKESFSGLTIEEWNEMADKVKDGLRKKKIWSQKPDVFFTGKEFSEAEKEQLAAINQQDKDSEMVNEDVAKVPA